MRVLVTGAAGQLGRDLVAELDRLRTVEVTGAGRKDLDVSDRDMVMTAVNGLRPDVIVHAAAWTAVDGCETDPERAFKVNSLGTRNIAEAARFFGSHVCYVSTDYVFDGRAGRAYVEWDQPNPLSVYGRSKLGGELELDPGSTVVRTSWVCGAHGSNIVRTVLELASRGQTLRFVDDQWGCPTFTPGLASKITLLALERRAGVYHVTHQGPTSWYGFVQAILEAAGQPVSLVQPIKTAELDPPRPAPRPAYSVLDNAAMRLSGLELLPEWHEPLGDLVKALKG
ncbi:MAG: dTDP-4-dehydrorhamnose reductase [Actinobacteria bacterium]|nr:dTDP-4-dehydrorhamnose reductase [Actinomycetota bacterium]